MRTLITLLLLFTVLTGYSQKRYNTTLVFHNGELRKTIKEDVYVFFFVDSEKREIEIITPDYRVTLTKITRLEEGRYKDEKTYTASYSLTYRK